MQLTDVGLLAIDTPKGRARTDFPGLAFFLRRGDTRQSADAWIYISSAPIGPKEQTPDRQAYIQRDVAGFKERFKHGSVNEEDPMDLPYAKTRAPAYLFEIADKHNSIEQVIYIEENGRILVLVLGEKTRMPL